MRTKFKKLVIEAIHGLPHDETEGDIGSFTLGKVLRALKNKGIFIYEFNSNRDYFHHELCKIIQEWRTVKVNNEETTDDNQTDETISKLLELLEDRDE